MSYESDQLQAYETAEAARFLQSMKQEPKIMGVPLSQAQAAGQQVKDDINKVIGGGLRDMAQGAMDMGAELLTEAGEDFLTQSGLVRPGGEEIQLDIPAPRLPEVEEPEGFARQLARDFVQFGAGLVASPGGLITKSAFSDAFFDPEEGSLIKLARDYEVLPEVMEFLALDIDEDSDAEDRLKQRLVQAGEGSVLGAATNGIIRALKAIKNSPSALRRATNTFAQAMKATTRKIDEAGQAADTRIEQRAADTEVTLTAGADPTDAINAALSYAGRKVRKSGQIVGAPPNIKSQATLNTLRRNLEAAAAEGETGRFWYERSGKAILDALGGNKDDADKLAQAIAITSSATGVKTNFDFALQAFLQHKAGKPIKTGRFPASMSKRIQKVFEGEDWDGRKTNNFYVNLMREIDPSKVQGVTTDMWMMRAFGFKNADGSPYSGTPTDAQYTFVEEETKRIADQLGWEPQQVQAAIWVADKARKEGIDVKDAAFDYSDALLNNKAQISWESIPGRTGNHMPEMFDAPYEVQQEYHVAVSKAFLDENGNDFVAKELGIPTPGDFEAPGYFEGKVSPGTQTELAVPREFGGPKYGSVEPAALELMKAYAAIRGVAMKQDGVGFHRPFYNPKKADANGVELRIGRKFSEGETQRLAKILADASGHGEYNPIATRDGVRLINFDYLEFDNKEFAKLVQNAIDSLDLDDDLTIDPVLFNSQNGYVGNDWSANKNGEEYLNALRGTGRPDLQRKVRSIISRLQTRIDEIDTDFAERYGFTRNTDLNQDYRPGQIESDNVAANVANELELE